MENFSDFLINYIDLALMSLIVVGGVFITKYTADITRIKSVYKVLLMSIILSAIFYFVEGQNNELIIKYLITYLFTTSFYEVIVDFLLTKLNLKK